MENRTSKRPSSSARTFATAASDNRVLRTTFENGRLGRMQPILTGIPKAGNHNGGRLAFGPDGFLYAGTGEPNTCRSGCIAGVGMYSSKDGGDHWKRLPTDPGPDVVRMDFPTRTIAMAVDPAHPQHLYVALEVGGVIRSLDGGETWKPINNGLSGNVGLLDLHDDVLKL